MKIRKGDNVQIIAGKDKGKKGVVETVMLGVGKVVVSGINIAVKHQKPNRSAKQVGRINKPMPLDVSNIALVCGKCGKYARIGNRILADGSKERVCKKCGEAI